MRLLPILICLFLISCASTDDKQIAKTNDALSKSMPDADYATRLLAVKNLSSAELCEAVVPLQVIDSIFVARDNGDIVYANKYFPTETDDVSLAIGELENRFDVANSNCFKDEKQRIDAELPRKKLNLMQIKQRNTQLLNNRPHNDLFRRLSEEEKYENDVYLEANGWVDGLKVMQLESEINFPNYSSIELTCAPKLVSIVCGAAFVSEENWKRLVNLREDRRKNKAKKIARMRITPDSQISCRGYSSGGFSSVTCN